MFCSILEIITARLKLLECYGSFVRFVLTKLSLTLNKWHLLVCSIECNRNRSRSRSNSSSILVLLLFWGTSQELPSRHSKPKQDQVPRCMFISPANLKCPIFYGNYSAPPPPPTEIFMTLSYKLYVVI